MLRLPLTWQCFTNLGVGVHPCCGHGITQLHQPHLEQ